MFEVGKKYEITVQDCTDDDGNPSTSSIGQCVILEVAMPLIKYQQGDYAAVILNTHSIVFVSATLQ